jgi:hypothetical protein
VYKRQISNTLKDTYIIISKLLPVLQQHYIVLEQQLYKTYFMSYSLVMISLSASIYSLSLKLLEKVGLLYSELLDSEFTLSHELQVVFEKKSQAVNGSVELDDVVEPIQDNDADLDMDDEDVKPMILSALKIDQTLSNEYFATLSKPTESIKKQAKIEPNFKAGKSMKKRAGEIDDIFSKFI